LSIKGCAAVCLEMEVCVVGTFEESCVNQFTYVEDAYIKFLQ